MVFDKVKPYASKMQYNADKELLFVTHTSMTGAEVIVFFDFWLNISLGRNCLRDGSLGDFAAQQQRGCAAHVKSGRRWPVVRAGYEQKEEFLALQKRCVNFGMRLKIRYWNPALRKAFMERMTGLWDETFYDPSKTTVDEPVFDTAKLSIE